MISFQPTIVHEGLVEFNGNFSNDDTDFLDTYFTFTYNNRSIPPEISSLFDTQLPHGVESNLDIRLNKSLADYLSLNFSGKQIKYFALDLENSGYPDDTAPNLCLYFYRDQFYRHINMKRVGAYTFIPLDFTTDMQSDLFKSRDFSSWRAAADMPLLAYGFYGTFIIKKISFKFVDVSFSAVRFWDGYINCQEGVEEEIVGETEIEEPATYDFIGNVLSAGQTSFGNDVGEGYFSNSSNFQAITLNDIACFKCLDTDYFQGLNTPLMALEAGPFVLKMYLSLSSTSFRIEIIGNTYGLDYGLGGFSFMHRNNQFYFSRRTDSPMGGTTVSGSSFGAISANAFSHIEFSVDEDDVYRLFINGVLKKQQADCFDTPYRNDSTFIGRAGRYNKTWDPFHIAAMAFSRNPALISRENYTPAPIPY